MPAAYRKGDIASGHGCFPPTPSVAGSPDVFVNQIAVVRVGDGVAPHGCKKCPSHGRAMNAGSGTVFVNGRAVCRIGDAVGCGGSASVGSGDVEIGG
ncbi:MULTISPECIES: PAAR domain-containing protein [unclassified Pseudovibrio]|uniref:PAAR domain-containing protein n=1 Tax=unclassified Pseudovibrio TaxID=2627060 RepID=UPI0009ED9650|nr:MULTISPECIES: PAAR domain-containing protein [unclassified Pseudovibrio]